MNRNNIAEVIPLNIHLNKTFHYLIPPNLDRDADIGKRVKISFRNKKIVGIIINIIDKTNIENLKEIEEIIDIFPLLSREVLALTDWVSKYYVCQKETIIKHIIPSRASQKKIVSFQGSNPGDNHFKGKNRPVGSEKLLPQNNNRQFLLFDNHLFEDDYQTDKPLLFHYHNYKVRDRYYDKWIEKVLEQGKQVLILVPDQWCCLQLKKKLTRKYSKILGIFDKKATQNQKYLRFLHAQRGDIKIVIGTRSNVFLPFRNLGLIIVEQENSLLYKEERAPKYNSREVALARGKLGVFKVVLGTFAPSIETYWKAINKRYTLKTEKQLTYYHNQFPEIKVINMEEEKSFQRIVSFRLQQQIFQLLKQNKKIVLFLNRRGFAGYMICSNCGHVIRCPECGHLLSYHVEGNTKSAVCHFCGKKVKLEKYCPKCGKGKIKPLGAGTQYVETLIKRMFPKAVTQRLDIDISPKIATQKKVINEFNRGKIDILIGTQLLFRELRYQNVGLLGFILADHLLNMQDYRSAEFSFQFIYQVALHLAEQKNTKQLLIQTYQPEHHSLQMIEQLDYSSFYQKEMVIRNELEYPPLTAMIKIDFTGKKREQVRKNAFDFIDYANQSGLISKYELGVQLNRDNMIIVREKDKNKASFVLRINSKKQIIDSCKESLWQYILKYQSNDVKLMIDVDPIKMY